MRTCPQVPDPGWGFASPKEGLGTGSARPPVVTAITACGLGSEEVLASNCPWAYDAALLEPGRRLRVRQTPDPTLALDPDSRVPLRLPAPDPAPGPPERGLPRAMAPLLALPASAAARLTQGTQRAPSNGHLATAPLPSLQRLGHVISGRSSNPHFNFRFAHELSTAL